MLVSVLITTYNLENYIAEALDSVLQQETSFPVEILVGDDGSSDGTVEIVQEYSRRFPGRITLYRMPREAGVVYNRVNRSAANRLNLLEHAKGEYCTFLDGDDYYIDPKKLQRQADILEKPENADCVMCAHNLLMAYPDGHEMPLCRAKKEHKFRLEQYWKLMFLQANAVLFRNIYKEDKPQGALAANFDDNNITFWLFRHGKMYYLPECMGAYRQVQGSSWNAIDLLKQSASNMIGYSIERELAPRFHRISDIRHYPDLKYLYEHRQEYRAEELSPFYETAKECGLKWALGIYHIGEKDNTGEDRKRSLQTVRRHLRRGHLGYFFARGNRAVLKLLGKY
ncbi:MAG: glycosyltransferase [Lachnospiraceae bacterium]|nr:glycosyltransferase [Lachnospiraceae bacterium]